MITIRKDEIILYILYALHLNGIKELSFFFTNELELHDMTTHNSQKKKGVVHLPKGEQRMMNIESFEEYVKNKIKEQKEMDQATTNLISSDHNKLTINNFNLLKTLGKGGFGKVYLVQHKTTKELFALKTIKKLFIIEKKQFEQVQREKEILYEANHPFLVGLKAAFQTPDKLFFLMPFVQGGDLYASLKRRKIFTEEEVRFFVAQIIEGLGFLHTKDIIYQDIKPENILMEKNGYIKLADFGAAKYVSQTKNYKTFVGTADYIAPEVLKKLPYTKSVDWWGVGILIFELLFGRTPFFNKNTKISFRMILTENPIFPENAKVSEECKDFILQVNSC
jgi:serum/glucocorticoid-regulated kinase 2